MPLPALPPAYDADREVIRRVAAHVLSRARSQAVGRIGLVPTPGGIGTPAFGDDATVVRLSPAGLVVDRGGDTATRPWAGATLRSFAELAGADLDADLDVGADTPPLGDPDLELTVDPASVGALGTWHFLGWQAIETVLAELPSTATPARLQLWPEHFDAGTNVAVGPGEGDRANLGAASGDEPHPEPYLYVGPWGPDRPGDAAYWNAPFGAVLGRAELSAAPSPLAAAVAFLRDGLARLGASS